MRIKLLFILIILSLAAVVYSAEDSTLTIVTTIEGKVTVFDYPIGIIPAEIRVGVIIERVSEYIARAEVNKRVKLCYIPYEIRYEPALVPGVSVLLKKNIRRVHGTEYDILSIGKKLDAGFDFIKGKIESADPKKVAELVKLADEIRKGLSSAEEVLVTDIKSEALREVLREAGVTEEGVPVTEEAPSPVTTPTTTTTTIITPPAEEEEEETFPEVTIAPESTTTTTTTTTAAALTISTSSPLTGASEGTAYSTTLSASGGTSPYTWSIVSGSLPSGLSLSSGGVISGTPATNTASTTSYSFTVRVTDNVGNTADKAFTLKVSGAAAGSWAQVNTSGFGSSFNTVIPFMTTFGSYIYAGTNNSSTGGQIWRSSDGTTWTQVNTSGFGIPIPANNSSIESMTTFGSFIYAGTTNTTDGGQIWRSPDGTTWTQVNTSGFGIPTPANNSIIQSMTTFGSFIYAGTKNTVNGGQIWRSSDGTTWTQVNTSGFGIPTPANNSVIRSMTTFGSFIYAGTENTTTGAQIWRSSDGTTWTQVNTSGFGSSATTETGAMISFGSYIYAGAENSTTGGQIWRSSDGTTWTQVNTSGFGSASNIATVPYAILGSYLYAWTQNLSTGGQIWRSSDGTTWVQDNTSGFGSASNFIIPSMATFGSYIYAGTLNLTTGTQIWRTAQTAIDPAITGKVYDSVTGENIDSPITSIYQENSTTALSSTTNNPYSFNVLDGKYYFRVEKEGYTFPSNTLDGITAGDHGEVFTASGTTMTIDIPIDSGYPLEITKTANKRRVVNGDIITYDIKIRNNSMWDLLNINIIDDITNGFKYASGKTYTDDTQLSEKNISISNREATFKLTNVPGHKVTHLTYQVRVGSGISPGEYKTTAVAWDRVRDWRMSNESSNKIEVVYDALFTMGTIIGKVYNDENKNGIQDRGEKGIPNVRIATEYGVIVETDKDGKYHIPAVPPGNHLLKVDGDWQFTTENPYFVKITEGLLAKVNFGVNMLASERVSELAGKEEPADPQTRKPANQFFIVALGEGVVRNLDTSGNIDMVEQDDRFDSGVNVDGKLALYLKGKIKGKYLVTLSLDTERRPTRRGNAYQIKKLFTNLDPDKYYPVYGDSSKIDYSAVDTQDELYLLIEWDESFIKYGAFNTEIPLYNRTLQGLNIVYESTKKTRFGDPYTKINAFYARAYQVAAHDEFIGTGGSLYYLRHTPVIEGSEKVRVELRDQVSKEAQAVAILTEERDYEIDYDTGRILLKRPLASVNYSYNASIISNDILTGSRAYLIIDYEYESTSTIRREAYGIKASQWIGNHIKAGGTYIEEQKTDNYYKLMGGDSAIKINEDTEITGEYNRSEETQLSGSYSIDGGLSYSVLNNTANDTKTGSSVSVKGKTKLFNNTDINLGYTRQDDNYSATNTISTSGSSIYTGSILTKVRDNLLVGVKHITQEVKDATLATDLIGNNKVHTTTALIDYIPNKWDIRLEYQHQETEDPFIDFTYAGYRQLMDHDIIGGRIGYKLTPKLHPYIGGQGTLNGQTNNQGYIGLEYRIWENTNLRIKETVGNLGNSTLIGLTSQITPETLAYTNIEIGNSAQLGQNTKTTTGQRTQIDKDSSLHWERDYSSYQQSILQGELIGYDTKLTDTLSLGTSYERAQIEKEETAISRDSGSITLSYLNIDRLKAFTKLELREDRGTETKRQWLTQNSILYQLSQDISIIGRGNWSETQNRTQHSIDSQFHETGIGLAYRPVNFDRLNLLAKYSYITNDIPESQNDFSQAQQDIRNIYAIEGAYDVIRPIQLVGKFAMRDLSEKVGPRDWTDSETYLYIARLNFHITNKWDIAGEYRTLANKQIEDSKSGWLLEIDRELARYIRFGVGYNFTDYDDDLSNSDNYDATGWFVRVDGKY